jgi:hypothetical protein
VVVKGVMTAEDSERAVVGVVRIVEILRAELA